MTSIPKRRLIATAVLMVMVCIQAQGTTIVFCRDKSRILVAADRRGTTHPAPGTISASGVVTDNNLKIRILGRVAFSAVGLANYRRDLTAVVDPIGHDWDTYDEAQAVFQAYGDKDVARLADEWAARAVAIYSKINTAFPAWLSSFASQKGNVISVGLFFVWEDGEPRAITRIITFAPLQLAPTISSGVLPITENPLATDQLTDDLNDPKTEVGKAAADRWNEAKKKVKPDELSFRYLQFLIEETSKIDAEVSPDSDVLEVPLNGNPKWIVPSDR